MRLLGFHLLSLMVAFGVSSSRAAPTMDQDSAFKALRIDRLDQLAPELDLKTPEGKTWNLKQAKAKPAILHFWAVWCTSCQKELPELAQVAGRWSQDGASFIPVLVEGAEKKDDLARIMSGVSGTLDLWQPTDKAQARHFWGWGLPVTYFIDSRGKIVGRALGARNWANAPHEALDAMLELLKTNR